MQTGNIFYFFNFTTKNYKKVLEITYNCPNSCPFFKINFTTNAVFMSFKNVHNFIFKKLIHPISLQVNNCFLASTCKQLWLSGSMQTYQTKIFDFLQNLTLDSCKCSKPNTLNLIHGQIFFLGID